MERLTKEQMAKLPKWAQSHIESCHSSLDYYRQERRDIFSTPAGDAQVLLSYFHGTDGKASDDQPLPSTQRVRFFPNGPGEHRWDHSIEICIDPNRPGELDVHGSGKLFVLPHATNALKLMVGEV